MDDIDEVFGFCYQKGC